MNPQLKLAFEALSKDAAIWDEAGGTLDAARNDLATIGVDRGAFSFAATDVADLYAELHQRVMGLLTDGAESTRAGASALRAVRDEFQQYEDITQSQLSAIWQPAV